MKSQLENSIQAIIVLHEIYGVNEFIKDQCQKFMEAGFDVFCPNMIHKPPFSYDKVEVLNSLIGLLNTSALYLCQKAYFIRLLLFPPAQPVLDIKS